MATQYIFTHPQIITSEKNYGSILLSIHMISRKQKIPEEAANVGISFKLVF